MEDKKTIGKVYALKIKNFSSKELRKIVDKHCTPNTFIIADKWSGYKPFKKSYPNLVHLKSEKGKNFPELYIIIRKDG